MSINKGINPVDVTIDHSGDRYTHIINSINQFLFEQRISMLNSIAVPAYGMERDARTGKISYRMPMGGAKIMTGADVASLSVADNETGCVVSKPRCVGSFTYLDFDKGMPWGIDEILTKCNITLSGNNITEADYNSMVNEYLRETNRNLTIVEDTYAVSTMVLDPSKLPAIMKAGQVDLIMNIKMLLANLQAEMDQDGVRQYKVGRKILTVTQDVWNALAYNDHFMSCCTMEAEKLAMLGLDRAAIGFEMFDLVVVDTTGLLEKAGILMTAHYQDNLQHGQVVCEKPYTGPEMQHGRPTENLYVYARGEKIVNVLFSKQVYAVEGTLAADQKLTVLGSSSSVAYTADQDYLAPTTKKAPAPKPAPEVIK